MKEIIKTGIEEENDLLARGSSDLLGDMPNWLIYTGSYIIYGVILTILIGSALFRYPDTLKKRVTIDNMGSVEWITASQAGEIDRFLVENNSEVKRGDTLGIMKNAASLNDVRKFCEVLTNVEWYYRTHDTSYLKGFPFDLIMGEMAPAYEQFTQAVRMCLTYDEYDVYQKKKKFLKEELDILNRSGKATELELLDLKREMYDLDVNHQMEQDKNYRMLELAYENMVNSLKAWDGKYLIKSGYDGTVIWGNSWGFGHLVNQGDTLCTVISKEQGMPVGHIMLAQEEIVELTTGDVVNIELNKYPSRNYGYLSGEVKLITFIPNNRNYAVEVFFPKGLITTKGVKIDYEIDLVGQAQVITESRSVLNRILSPVMEVF